MHHTPPELDQLKQKITRYLNTRQVDKAEKILKTLCDERQADPVLWQMYANVQYLKGNFFQMENCCRKILEYQPNDVNTLFNLACALTTNNKIKEAEKYFKAVIQLNPKHSVAYDNLGQLYEEAGNIDAARICYESATNGDNVQAIHYRHLGVIDLKRKDPVSAEKHFLKGMALDNRDAKSYVELGRAQCEIGKIDDATQSFKAALKINPNLNYARFWLSAINDQRSTDAAKHRFVSRLFDGHAEDFDKILVSDLGYNTPWIIADALPDIVGDGNKLDILDIGCGTGLCADSLKSWSNSIVGIDLSEKMLSKAKIRGLYKNLLHGDIVDMMLSLSDKFDLIVAADVFVYVGGLIEVFDACKKSLNKDGLFIFTIEKSDNEDGFMLRATGRYAHSDGYIEQLAMNYGFAIISNKEIVLRTDACKQILGQIFILRLN